MAVSIVCAIYFASVGFYRFKNKGGQVETGFYAPLAQLESTDTDDDYDDDL